MGNFAAKALVKETPPPPVKEDPKQIFTYKEQFLECWTPSDVQEWLIVNDFEEYVQCVEENLVLDGDGLMHLGHTILSHGQNPEALPGQYDIRILEKLKEANPSSFEKLAQQVVEVVSKYNSLLIRIPNKDDEEFPPYEYPVAGEGEEEHKKNLVMFYHVNTQHTQGKGSRAVERKWLFQPRTYRRYYGALYLKLPLPPTKTTPYNDIFFPHERIKPLPFSKENISEFLYYALGVSGKRDLWTLTSSPRAAWTKRMNPSSGGLHPIECYVIMPPNVLQPDSAVYHYSVQRHALECRGVLGGNEVSKNSFVVGISAIPWREVWKYGERGYRYSMLDAGHAIGSLCISAAKLGWKITLLPDLATDIVENLLGISDTNRYVDVHEKEHGLILGLISKVDEDPSFSLPTVEEVCRNIVWEGSPNHLSSDHTPWDIVDIVNNATKVDKIVHIDRKGAEKEPSEEIHPAEEVEKLTGEVNCESVILNRRSALDYVGKPMSLHQFSHILHAVSRLEAFYRLHPMAHLFIFAYNISDLAPGLYVFVRNNEDLEDLKNHTKDSGFSWSNTTLYNLYLLKEVPKEDLALQSYAASCNQHIAKEGCFSLGMFVNLEKGMQKMGTNFYRSAHYECGALGQVLYLEAQALGLGATGMGCFLDDLARHTFGLSSSPYWSLYHFAIGVPMKDSRYMPYSYSESMFEGVLEECIACVKPR